MEKIKQAPSASLEEAAPLTADTAAMPRWRLYTNDEKPLDNFSVEPTIWHGRLARLANDKEFYDGIAEPLSFPPERYANNGLAFRATNDFLHSCYADMCSVRKDLTFTNAPGSKETPLTDACASAENHLVRTFNAMAKASGKDIVEGKWLNYERMGWSIVIGEDEQPIAVKKSEGQPTALSLAPITIDGRSFPAGSLLELELKKTRPLLKLPFTPLRTVSSYKNVKRVRFLRLTAFAHDPNERKDVFHTIKYDDPFTLLSLDALTEIARQSIENSKPVRF